MSQENDNEENAAGKIKFSRRRAGYGPVAAITVTLLTYILSQFFAATFLGVGAGLFGYDPQEVLRSISDSTLMQFIYISLVQAITLYVIWLFLKARSVPWKSIGLGRLPKLRDILPALAIFGIYFVSLAVITFIVTTLVPAIDVQQQQQLGFENIISPAHLLLVFVGLVLLPPIVEEIVIRGFLYTGLRAKYTKITSAIIASVLFGVAHLQLGSGAPPLWIAAIDTAVLSLFLIYLREKTGALWAGMIVHGMKNGLAFLLLFVVKWG